MKETFIIRTEWQDAIFDLDPLDQAVIFQNLFHFHSGKENLINLNNLTVKLVWKLIQPNLVRNIDNYDKRKDTSSENGKKGGRPSNENKNNLNNLNKPNPKPNENQKPNESLSVSDSVSVFVSDTVDKEKENKEKIEIGIAENGSSDFPAALLLKTPVSSQPIVQSMVEIFKTAFPNCFPDKERDFPACQNLAEKICTILKIPPLNVSGGNMEQVKSKWKDLIDFAKADQWYSSHDLVFLNKNFTDFIQKFNSKGKDFKQENKYGQSDQKQISETHELLRKSKEKTKQLELEQQTRETQYANT